MLPDRVSNPGPLTYESGALPIALRGPASTDSRKAVVSYWRKYVHEVLVNRLGGLSLPRKSMVRLTDRPDMTIYVYRGRKAITQQQQQQHQKGKARKRNLLSKSWQKYECTSVYILETNK